MPEKDKLKKRLHELIDGIEDEQVLNVLNNNVVPYVIQFWTKRPDDDLTEEQGKQLDDLIAGAGREETISYEEFAKNIDEWIDSLKSTND